MAIAPKEYDPYYARGIPGPQQQAPEPAPRETYEDRRREADRRATALQLALKYADGHTRSSSEVVDDAERFLKFLKGQ